MTCIASNDGKCIGISFVCMNGPVCIESEEVEPPIKLVRDKIPQIIRENGDIPVTYTASPEEYRAMLRAKLIEETQEFLNAGEETAPEELADILEVVRALAIDLRIGINQLEKIRKDKATKRGSFFARIIWTGNRRPNDE